ncbi:MAG: hypothetical protein KC657_02185 [Myxococcales bacterium]|nr:hypothetical protein [Myxococcales bacterium]MCB1892707.1 hypothetical protein [Rhodocyclaceae bacterium]MCP5295907.1 hypothetical protein [Zoogloeaceae bacterium]MCW5595556.1 hypothetical protein [Rhodocyclaceae bacterium]PKO68370.1 MAG: hypothetical protein CVU20_13200 [Betaproteobacteria bacterium HGW-Betaproteobacteria-14]
MQNFEYLIRSDIHPIAEKEARIHGSREKERLQAYTQAVADELNKLGAQGWELVQAPDQTLNRNWIFKRPLPS